MNKKDQMHPEDVRNLIIFAVLTVFIWIGYEHFILGPQKVAMEKARKAKAVIAQQDPEALKPVEFVSREDALKGTARLSFNNEEVYGTIALKGGRFDDLHLHNYFETMEKKKNVSLLTPNKSEHARYIDTGWVGDDQTVKLPGSDTLWQIQGNKTLKPGSPVTLTWDNGQGLRFEREIALDKEYLFTITQRVYNDSGVTVSLHPYALVSENGLPSEYSGRWIMHEGPMGFIGDELKEVSYKNMKKEPNTVVKAATGWAGISDKYWLTALIPAQGQESTYRFRYTPDYAAEAAKVRGAGRYQTDFTGSSISVSPGQKIENSYNLFVGAKKVLALEEYQKNLGVRNLDLAVDFGWFWFLTKPFYFGLHYLYLAVGNMGVAIIILTIIIRGAAFPLTRISYRSFAKMKNVTPQIHELRSKYGDDKVKLQEAITALYQKEGVNPMAGCLPMLVQIPIFFAWYKIIFMTLDVRHAPFFGWIQDLSARDPTSIFNLFGLLPYELPTSLHIGVWPCLMLVVMIIQKRLNPPPQDKIQRDMMTYFPFIMTYVMAGFASGLVIYWTVSGLMSIIQQAIIMRSLGVPIYLFEKDKYEEQLKKDLEKGPDVHPLVEMAGDDVEDALFGGDDSEGKDIKPLKPKKKKKKK
ncbi:MAG: membrane protein insertase YidC [Alphaproteobacteria bacterium]|nr:membrane protein insertase YidC [Alphaproteobacteria bacterium]